jgi:hypothetical protein
MQPFTTPLPTLHSVAFNLVQTQPQAMRATANVVNRVGILQAERAMALQRAAALMGTTPLQKAVLLDRSLMLDRAALRNGIEANLLNQLSHLTPAERAILNRTLLRDQALVNQAALMNGLNRLALFSGYNPYATFGMPTTAMYAPISNPYATSGQGGYPMMGYSGGGYSGGGYPMNYGGNQSSTSAQQTNPYAYVAPTTSTDESAGTILDALGVPTKNGHLSWPLGLRIVAPAPTAAALRQQIDGILQLAATQPSGKLSAGDVELATSAAEQLRGLLKKNSGSVAMAESTYRDANRFLDRLEVSLLAMKNKQAINAGAP